MDPTDQIPANNNPPATVHESNDERLEISALNDETKLGVDEMEEDKINI